MSQVEVSSCGSQDTHILHLRGLLECVLTYLFGCVSVTKGIAENINEAKTKGIHIVYICIYIYIYICNTIKN